MRFAAFLLPAVVFGVLLPGRGSGRPVYGSELDDFKALLQRLEDKLGPREAGPEEDVNEPGDEVAGDVPESYASWDEEYPRPPSEGGFGWSGGRSPQRVPPAARDRLAALLGGGPRRASSCFGQRLDRIGATSRLGCKRNRN